MNAEPTIHLSLLPILLLLLLLLILTGTALGWVAAGRIRQSDGALYGLGLAAFAGMLFPSLILVALPVFAFIRFRARATFSASLTEADAVILGVVAFATISLLSLRSIQAGFRKILGKGTLLDTFRPGRNRLLIASVSLLWIMLGVLLFLQRPRPMGDTLKSDSPDGSYQVEASTWQRMRIFGSDELCYRFMIRDRDGHVHRSWEIPVKRLTGSGEGSELADQRIGEVGSIHWEKDGSEVIFRKDGTEISRISTNPVGIPSAAGVAGTGEVRVLEPD